MNTLSLSILTLALLAACTPQEQEIIQNMMDDASSGPSMMEGTSGDGEMMEDDSVMPGETMMKEAVYTSYDPSVLANGETKVLFFHAAWCPTCRAVHTDLEAWYAQGLPTVSVYKVDYDTETALKSRYGVTYQHTFVLVDGEGNAIETVQGPTDDVLLDLIGA